MPSHHSVQKIKKMCQLKLPFLSIHYYVHMKIQTLLSPVLIIKKFIKALIKILVNQIAENQIDSKCFFYKFYQHFETASNYVSLENIFYIHLHILLVNVMASYSVVIAL